MATRNMRTIDNKRFLLMVFLLVVIGYTQINQNVIPIGKIEWQHQYRDDDFSAFNEIHETNEGYILVGYTAHPGSYILGDSVLLVKTDKNGEKLWTERIGKERAYADGLSAQITSDGGYIVVGHYRQKTASCVYVLKTDVNGNREWERFYGNDSQSIGQSIRNVPSGGYIVTGSTDSVVNEEARMSECKAFLLKLNEDGDVEWNRSYVRSLYGESLKEWNSSYIGISHTRATSVLVTPDGGYVFVGDTLLYGNYSRDVFIAKVDLRGNLVWSHILGGDERDKGMYVEKCRDGGFIVVGEIGLGGDKVSGVYLVRMSEDGDVLWESSIGFGYGGMGWCVKELNSGGFVVCGYSIFRIEGFGARAYVGVVDSSGGFVMERVFLDSYGGFRCLCVTDDGCVVVAGMRSHDGILMKIRLR